MSFEMVIGIEIHCELKTKTKMFSGAPVSFAQEPNTCVNEIDLAHPGTLPSLNKKAVELSLTACKLFHLEIDRLLRFDRKNYYYSDLPKGFQITQQFFPVGKNGYVDIDVDGSSKRVFINRLHMEEDTAKQFHRDDVTLIDFNRAGTPLIEIVSEADMRSGKEAAAYVEKLRTMLEYGHISDVKMEEGSMRCDVNISIRPIGVNAFGTKVEIKNLNSVNNVERAIEYEFERQKMLLLSGQSVVQETRRYDEATRTTVSMRKKEGSVDYKYFPEPNIFPVYVSDEMLAYVEANLPEMPEDRFKRYIHEYQLNETDAKLLVSNKALGDYFEQIVQLGGTVKLTSNWLISEVLAVVDQKGEQSFSQWINPTFFVELFELLDKQVISSKQAKEVFTWMLKGQSPKVTVEKQGLSQVSDESLLLSWVEEVITANPQSVIDYKNGKDRAVGFLVGQIMKLSKGKANPALTSQMVKEALSKR